MEVGEDGVDPDDPEHAGAEDDDDGRHYRLAQAAGGPALCFLKAPP